jgi:hypothetical protein
MADPLVALFMNGIGSERAKSDKSLTLEDYTFNEFRDQ